MKETVLIVHGLGGSGPDHWQTWLAASLRWKGMAVAYPSLPDPGEPSLEAWLARLGAAIDRVAPESLVVACHSLGAVTWCHLAARADRRLAKRALLVAPPSAGAGIEEIAEFVPAPHDAEAIARTAGTTRVVCGEGDPYLPEGPELYEPLGVPIDVIEGGGHLNTDAGYGPWPAVERWCLDGEAVPISGR